MRKVFEVSGFVLENDGVAHRLYMTIHAVNEEKAVKFFKRDIANLKHCYEWQILNTEVVKR